ncbi:hypothetical protein HDU85_000331 [Gaertneriomyces sp. JEL0708]|nr:hypothetical protein HDU85_000331 [Gaertneriomyces sp. JEL0708]
MSTPPSEEQASGYKVKTPLDIAASQISKLMSNIEKPVHIPTPKDKTASLKQPRDFVRNVQGSSAGAGSGEFHVYRALRRKEYKRLEVLEHLSKEEQEQRAFQEKIAAIREQEAARTAKKREKRKKRRQNVGSNKKARTDVDDDGGSQTGKEEDEKVTT